MSETTILSEVKETLDFAVAEDDGFDDRLLLELDGLIGELSQLTYVKEDFVLTKDSKYEQLLKKNDPNLLRLVKTLFTSLEQLKLVNNADKKAEALRKLATYAKEVGIKLTEDQAEDYIENAVAELRKLQGKLNKEG